MTPLTTLEKQLGIKFKKPILLEQAFVHRSYLNENEFEPGHNERLEFLGDAVLELVVTEYLYHKFTDKPEGELTALRSALVKKETLKQISDELKLYQYLKLSKGEAKGVNNQVTILANVVESLVGAIFLDGGIKPAQKFLATYLLPKLDVIIANQAYLDAKSQFQEAAQDKAGITPIYKVVAESGPDHNKIFEVAVLLGEQEIARGIGPSKQSAEMAAAEAALEKYR
ncbi:ribonuclease III [candidate division Kazan bacterium RIFCSPHIGHO2_01_FULL_49_10]|uniref:Ribonuclease 3 n=1 Tax=candidate division Kazan bacterium RIFCSPLOWO2_01_FULL_48_13 TaxID=1798539 RepID=A0A1F4PPL5_UNCK3|nr:MAG: ribonuclease III [candidate division Kazan bacterium RIFCSPHIGHO2_01_FULL_49_10]OGB85526.1 MAG: ribonuclease III [candidate division Kazan bacterium RIFCSPLOWO2_01_FULL_48_13]